MMVLPNRVRVSCLTSLLYLSWGSKAERARVSISASCHSPCISLKVPDLGKIVLFDGFAISFFQYSYIYRSILCEFRFYCLHNYRRRMFLAISLLPLAVVLQSVPLLHELRMVPFTLPGSTPPRSCHTC